jgi:uncharacterized protein YkwD
MGWRLGSWALAIASVGALVLTAAPRYLAYQPTPDEIAEATISRINAERVALGHEPLLVNLQLMQMAQWRSEDMVAGAYYDHQPPEGHPTLYDLSARLGYHSRPTENLVWVPRTFGRLDNVAERAVSSWKASRSHWRLATSRYERMTGVGVAVGDGYVIITQLFWDGGMSTPEEAWAHNRDTE